MTDKETAEIEAVAKAIRKYVTGREDGWAYEEGTANAAIRALSALRASTQGGEEIVTDLKDVKQRLLDGLADYEKDQADGWDRGERPDLWDHVVEIPVADAMKILAALSSAPSIRDQDEAIEDLSALVSACVEAFGPTDEYDRDYEDICSPPSGITFGMIRDAQTAIRSLSTKPTAGEGWVMVPKEPTTVQVNAGVDADDMRTGFETVKVIYRAMIAAAPAAPAKGEDA